MGIKREDVSNALAALEGHLPETEVSKAEKSDDDLGEANGAATAKDGGSLKAEGDDMNKKHGNTKGKGFESRKSLAKAKKDEEEDEGEEEEGDDEEEEEKEEKSMVNKSVPKDYMSGLNNEVITKIDVSNFLRSLVDHTADSVDNLRDFVVKSDMVHESRYEELMTSVEEIQKSQANIGIVLRAVCERIGVIENQPARMAKSVTAESQVKKSVQAVDRSMPNHDPALEGEGEQGMFKSLQGKAPHVAKAMVSDAICELVKKGEAKDVDVINFETFGHITPELEPKLRPMLG